MKKAFVSPNAPAPLGPYSQVVLAGNFLYTAGQIALKANGEMVQGDAAAQARQVLNNIKAVLQAAGATMDSVVKTTIFLTELADFDAVNKVYGEYFREPFPARSTVQAARLPKGALVEIDAIATI